MYQIFHTYSRNLENDDNEPPFLSKNLTDSSPKGWKQPAFGEGYYFWDELLTHAQRWAKIRYSNENYGIFSCNVSRKAIFNPFCSSGDAEVFNKLLLAVDFKLKQSGFYSKPGNPSNIRKTPLHFIFTQLRILDPKGTKIFPYGGIRVPDKEVKEYFAIYQNNEEPKFAMPTRWILCLFEKNLFQNARIVETS